jgi:ubiquinone/menaquinone biosynthesis C-methylase UbiE
MAEPEFSGLKGRFFAWFLTSPMRRILDKKMGKPDARFLELLELRGDETVVDLGAGSGYHALMVAERLATGRVTAVDVSSEMLDRLERLAARRGVSDRVETLLADGTDLPIESESADLGMNVAVWHHMDDPLAGCRELVRALRPGGRVVSVDLHIGGQERDLEHIEGHDRRFGPEEMGRLLADSGLEDVQTETLGRWVLGSGRKPTSGAGGEGRA